MLAHQTRPPTLHLAVITLAAALLITKPGVAPLGAQATPKVLFACYIKSSGTVYRIKEANTPAQCTSNSHVEFSWTDAVGGDHGALSGLADDDHLQYVLANGVRGTTNGFAVTGTFGVGSIPTSGLGTRVMWYPGKAAFRAGDTRNDGVSNGTTWDDLNIGTYSAAFGRNTTASGTFSIAMGLRTGAYGNFGSTAMGYESTANGTSAIAMGSGTIAYGDQSTAMGLNTIASGERSTAIGQRASTNFRNGSFVYGDNSSAALVENTSNNQFMVRASGGTIFYSVSDLTAGVTLDPGAGAWASVSDVRRKENFRDLDADSVLARIARLSVREWNYKAQDSSVRHVGPTAQDFYSAFKLSANDTTITTTDIDGVALLAIQALERRTTELHHKTEQVARLEARLSEVERRLAQLLDDGATTRRPAPSKP